MKSIGREEEREGWKMEWRKTERDGGWDGEGESWGRDGTHLPGSGGSSSGTLQTCVE